MCIIKLLTYLFITLPALEKQVIPSVFMVHSSALREGPLLLIIESVIFFFKKTFREHFG